MSPLSRLTLVLTGTVAAFAWAHGASAADLLLSPVPIAEADVELPAVSAVNGKWQLDLGLLNSTGAFRGAASLSIPVGDRFGLQGDLMIMNSGAQGTVFGGAVHAFTRDPSSYLLGVAAGVVVTPDASITAVGVEGELYIDRISLEGWAGLAQVDYVSPPPADVSGVFGFVDAAYYPTDDLRFALGASYIVGSAKAHVSAEYLMRDYGIPLSLTADARIGSGNYVALIGIKGYFGGNDDNKSLIDRHRQDDPHERPLDLYAGASDVLFDDEEAPPPVDTEQACLDRGGTPILDNEYPYAYLSCIEPN